jgi:hypothetical protein
MLGAAQPLHSGEIKLAGTLGAMPNVVSRTWEYWSARLDAGGTPVRRTAAAPRRDSKAKSGKSKSGKSKSSRNKRRR